MDFIHHDNGVVEGVRGRADHGLQFARRDTIVIDEANAVVNREFQLCLDFIALFGVKAIKVRLLVEIGNPETSHLRTPATVGQEERLRNSIDVLCEHLDHLGVRGRSRCQR